MTFFVGWLRTARTLAWISVLCGGLAATVTQAWSADSTVGISAVWTYLYVPSNEPPGAVNAVPIELAPLGIAAGDTLRLEQLGTFSNGPAGDTLTRMIGVFSGSGVLLTPTLRYRVQDAIDAGTDFTTGNAHWDNQPTDIPEDFWIDDIVVFVPAGATHLFVTAYDTGYWDNSDPNGDFAVRLTTVHATGTPPITLPQSSTLKQNEPNPFNPQTTIRYVLSVSGHATVEIYDVRGRRVRTLLNEVQGAGPQSVVWDGRNNDGISVVSGTYLYQLRAGDFVETRRMVLIK